MERDSRIKIKLVLFISLLAVVSGGIFVIPKLLPQKRIVSPEYIKMELPALTKESTTIVKGTVIEVLPSTKEAPNKVVIGEKAAKEVERKGETLFTKILIGKEAAEAEKRGESNFYVASNEKGAQKLKKQIEEENAFIYTDKIIQVDEYLKNPLGQDKIIVKEMGGKLGNATLVLAGEVPLKVGDKVLLFLQKSSENKYMILGGPQGKYHIKNNLATNEDKELNKKLETLESEVKTHLKLK